MTEGEFIRFYKKRNIWNIGKKTKNNIKSSNKKTYENLSKENSKI